VSRRSYPGGIVYHVVNRATQGQLLFRDHGEYLAFQRLLGRAVRKTGMRLLAYCLMPNHVHFLLWPRKDGDLARFMQWLTSLHARELHTWRGTTGRGAIYQANYRGSPVDTETYFYAAARYIEFNPVRAGFVTHAEHWPWSSASPSSIIQGVELAEWPVPRPRDWRTFVNRGETPLNLIYIRERIEQGKRLGPEREGEAGSLVATGATSSSSD
jgi:putative transposase